jgi:hypothetical protein
LSASNTAGLSDDELSVIHYLVRATSLLISAHHGDSGCKARYTALKNLAGHPSTSGNAREESGGSVMQRELHGRVAHALNTLGVDPAVFPLQEGLELLERDEVNGYGILAPVFGPEVSKNYNVE